MAEQMNKVNAIALLLMCNEVRNLGIVITEDEIRIAIQLVKKRDGKL